MKILFTTLLTIITLSVCNAQTTIYMRLIDYSNKSVYGTTSAFNSNPDATPSTKPTHADEVALTTFFDGESQVLNIGSQSTGAGAGKVTFDSLVFSKAPDVQSSKLFTALSSGAAFKWAEFSFYKPSASGDVIFYKIRLSLVAFKSIQRVAAACTSDCPDIVENCAIEYGAKYITVYTQNSNGSFATPSGDGWNRVKNTSWDGATALQ